MKLAFAGMGIELISLILGSIFIGQKIDEHYHLPGYATIAVLLLVLVGWFVRLLYLLRRINRLNGD